MREEYNINGFGSDFYGNQMAWFLAFVEEVHDAEDNRGADHLHRVAIRIWGLHETVATVEQCVLATVLMPNDQASIYDTGGTVGIEVGSMVVGFWLDQHKQHPCIIGALPGIEPPELRNVAVNASAAIVLPTEGGDAPGLTGETRGVGFSVGGPQE